MCSACGARVAPPQSFFGRARELSILDSALDEAEQGHGRLVLISGEPGIGKTRLARELAATARRRGALILWGAAHEGEWAPPYSPFAEALTGHVSAVDANELRADVDVAAATLARLVPTLRERLSEVSDPIPLQPDEERFRLFDSVRQFLIATARRAPVVFVVDDLHWADVGTIALLRHLARGIAAQRFLLIGTYRDTEVDSGHPLASALGALRREGGYARLALAGLDAEALRDLLQRETDAPLLEPLIGAIARETQGNPFFALEVLRHLREEAESSAALATTTSLDIARIGVPDGVRHVIARRLGRLSGTAHALLQAAAAADGTFGLAVTAAVAAITEPQALDAVDEALAAYLVAPAGPDSYAFTHALVRHTLYGELNPSRRLRLHRTTAEAMARVYVDRIADHAAEVADQYRLSAALPGAERGVDHAIAAAQAADAAYAHDRVAAFLQLALDLMRPEDPRRPRAMARLVLAHAWALQFEPALAVARDAARALAGSEGDEAAADFLCGVVRAMNDGGFFRGTAELTPLGLDYIGARRTLTWVRLKDIDMVLREASAGDGVGIPLDSPERREVRRVFAQLGRTSGTATSSGSAAQRGTILDFALGGLAARVFEESGTGAESELRVLASPEGTIDLSAIDADRRGGVAAAVGFGGPGLRAQPELLHTFIAGDYRRGLPMWRRWSEEAERTGRIGVAVSFWAATFRFHVALGEFAAARIARQRAAALAARLSTASMFTSHLVAGEDEWRMARDEDWDEPMTDLGPGLGGQAGPLQSFYGAGSRASIARVHARVGRVAPALRRLASVIPAIEQAPGWADSYVRIACDAAETLWLTRRTDWIETIERNLRDKVVAPDFRFPMMDGRLALARLCALQLRYDEALDWFGRARVVLDEQEARPLRAILDYDEALMYARRSIAGDRERARPLLERALEQFESIGMPGWIRRARSLLDGAVEYVPHAAHGASEKPAASRNADALPRLSGAVTLRDEGEFWTLAYAETTHRLKDSKGLRYLAHLLRHPGQEFHVLDLVSGEPTGDAWRPAVDDGLAVAAADHGLEILDGQAKADYRRRIADLYGELEEAEQFNDVGRAERARSEIDTIVEQLAAAVGLGGRDRTAAAASERARSTVTHRLRAAVRKIAADHPELADHLASRLKTGAFCTYSPDPFRPIEWRL